MPRMMTETLASTILTASITGAGLIIAIYALITPISRNIFEKRLAILREKKEEFERMKKEITSESSAKDTKKLTILAREIKEIRTFPRYLGPLVMADFLSFMLSSAFAGGWLWSHVEGSGQEYPVIISFIGSSVLFIVVGIYAIADVYDSMKADFEKVKKEKEEIEQAREQLEHFSLSEYAKIIKEKQRNARTEKTTQVTHQQSS